MKTSEFSGKTRRLIAILSIAFMSSLNLFSQTTITSTTSGGLWNTGHMGRRGCSNSIQSCDDKRSG